MASGVSARRMTDEVSALPRLQKAMVVYTTVNPLARSHKIVEKRYAVGQVSEYDFIRSQVTVSNAEPNVFGAENSVVLAL